MVDPNRQLIGGVEWCALPDLGLPCIKTRVDSGARTSSLHAWGIRRFRRDGRDFVSFRIHPLQRDRRTVVHCQAPLADRRGVRSSSGATEARYVIRTLLALAGCRFEVEITLTSRDAMGYRMLLGREAMRDRLIVDPSRSFLWPQPSADALSASYQPHRAAPHLDIGVLGGDDALHAALAEAARPGGHRLLPLSADELRIHFAGHQETVHGGALPAEAHLDVVLPMIDRARFERSAVLLRYFEQHGAYNPNPVRALCEAVDGALACQRLARAGIVQPPADWSADVFGVPPLADYPLRLLRPRGSGAARVLSPAAPAPGGVRQQPALVQHLAEGGELLGCLVVGMRISPMRLVVGADGILRRSSRRASPLSPQARRTIRRAVRALGVHLARVDVQRFDDEIRVLSVDPFGPWKLPARLVDEVARNLVHYAEKVTGASR